MKAFKGHRSSILYFGQTFLKDLPCFDKASSKPIVHAERRRSLPPDQRLGLVLRQCDHFLSDFQRAWQITYMGFVRPLSKQSTNQQLVSPGTAGKCNSPFGAHSVCTAITVGDYSYS